MSDEDLIRALERWQSIKQEAVVGETGDIDEPEYLAQAAGMDPTQIAVLQALVEPQLGRFILQAMTNASPEFPPVVTQAQLAAMAESAGSYYVEALMFGHWLRAQRSLDTEG
jgi:hypothetical protein